MKFNQMFPHFSMGDAIECPICGDNYLHIAKITAIDSGISISFACEGCGSGTNSWKIIEPLLEIFTSKGNTFLCWRTPANAPTEDTFFSRMGVLDEISAESLDSSKLNILRKVPSRMGSGIVKPILDAIRAGNDTPEGIKSWIEGRFKYLKGWSRLSEAQEVFEGGMRNSPYSTVTEGDINEAIDFYIRWEKLPAEEKNKIKQGRGSYYRNQTMQEKPPTEKQAFFIKSRGYDVPANSLLASELIDKLKNGGV